MACLKYNTILKNGYINTYLSLHNVLINQIVVRKTDNGSNK